MTGFDRVSELCVFGCGLECGRLGLKLGREKVFLHGPKVNVLASAEGFALFAHAMLSGFVCSKIKPLTAMF
jgi:hypothetical protein